MLRELGLGLVLMLGGDGDAARTAGTELIQDQIDDAIEAGSFEAVEYGTWSKGYDGGRFWLAFTDIDVQRDGAALRARTGLVYPLSVDMLFDNGQVIARSGEAWSFGDVRIDGAYSMFERRVSISSAGLARSEAADADSAARFDCPFTTACEFGLDATRPVEQFFVELSRRGGRAQLDLTLVQAGRCLRMHAERVQASRRSKLTEVGRSLLEDEVDARVVLQDGACALRSSGQRPEIVSPVRSTDAMWSARHRSLDALLRVLLVTVPGAYEYLVE